MVKLSPTELLREVPPEYMAHYVIDASVALKWVWSEEGADRARHYSRGAVQDEMCLSVPSLFWYELANALRYGSHRSTVGNEMQSPWQLIRSIPMHTIDFAPEAFSLITDLAARQEITVYDGAYVFLAQSLQVPLITSDAKLAERCATLPYVWLLDTM